MPKTDRLLKHKDFISKVFRHTNPWRNTCLDITIRNEFFNFFYLTVVSNLHIFVGLVQTLLYIVSLAFSPARNVLKDFFFFFFFFFLNEDSDSKGGGEG